MVCSFQLGKLRGMTQAIALIVNTALALGLLGMLAFVVRAAHRLPGSSERETLHPSQPLALATLHPEVAEDTELARVA